MRLIIGASSGVGLKLALIHAFYGEDLILCSTKKKDLMSLKSHIKNFYGVKVKIVELDLSDFSFCKDNYSKEILNNIKKITGIYFISGKTNSEDPFITGEELNRIININFSSLAYLLIEIIKNLPQSSQIIFTSSVACIRPRGSNTLYAASKNSMEFLITGIKHRFPHRAPFIKVVRFGYIDSQMTYGQKTIFPKVSSFKAANYLVNLTRNSPFLSYYPNWWRIFIFIRYIPFFIFKYLKF